jgi:RNA polymerase sigma-70 factor, ECF subfamily
MNVTRTSRTARLTAQPPTRGSWRPSDARLRITRPTGFSPHRQRHSWNCSPAPRPEAESRSRNRSALPPASFKDGLVSEIRNLRAFAISLSGSSSLADDLVQESLLRAWSNWEKFQPGTNLKAWLCTILRNLYYSNYRRRCREVQDSDGFYAGRLTVPGDQESHLDLEDFRKTLATLPVEQREVLTLIGASGLSYEEAAAVCGVGIGTIKSRLSRARSKLAELLTLDEPFDLPAERGVRRAG